MVLKKEDYVMLTCLCCLNITGRKKLLDISMNYRDGSTMELIHSYPSCGKQTKSVYKLFSQGPLNSEDGHQMKGYEQKKA